MRDQMALAAAIWWLQEAKHLLVQLPEGRLPPGLGTKAQVGRTGTPIGPTWVLDRNLGFPSLAWTPSCHETCAHRTFQNAVKGSLASDTDGLACTVLREGLRPEDARDTLSASEAGKRGRRSLEGRGGRGSEGGKEVGAAQPSLPVPSLSNACSWLSPPPQPPTAPTRVVISPPPCSRIGGAQDPHALATWPSRGPSGGADFSPAAPRRPTSQPASRARSRCRKGL